MHFSSHYFTRFCSGQGTSSLQSFPTSGLDHLVQSLSAKGLSSDVISNLLKDVEEDSIKKYQSYWVRFAHWCIPREISPGNLSVNTLCKFFIFMFDSGLSASTLKFVKSSIYFFLRESHEDIINHYFISRLLKAFEKLRPTIPRYVVTWDVNKVLCFLKKWYPNNTISLKQLTLKTCMLIALSSSDRAQTIQKMRIDHCVCTARGVEFPIFAKLKTSRHLRKPRVVICPKWSDPSLDVEKCVTDYMTRTLTLRCRVVRQKKPKPNQLFISHKSGLPVAHNTISRWLTEVMSLAGIDTSYFTGHSTRGASTSKAKRRGANPNQLIIQGDWKNVTTFTHHYDREILGPALSDLILGQ